MTALLGPVIGPVFGGIIAQFLSWRAMFYFAAGYAGENLY